MSGFDLPGLGEVGRRLLPHGAELAPRRTPELIGETSEREIETGGAPFGGLLADAVDRAAGLQQEVRSKTEAMLMGEPVAMHDIMLAMGKSEVTFNLMLEVRNKLVEAWEKLSRSVM